ncbi:ABC transporter ATP-binding protein [Enterococcus dongliensis]|uniref:ABC transporter ATP-binding protein n=1 Tax=Enterococcus dongliensis TaxID=2559925 RepID=A0AAP5KR17_9ENTE|nr:ABC transporter ATP-binding protein [Enterococcus dongliensis]MDT2597016.1 ABC transporter ATP-binding protein [Enterococcus dongliensis]MDT2603036.1 ABC transporter ATP-binding protein [Enterococcus dongliensis]MDT2633380.1 ABC transporter ATP-binding protein [Enterococcus dongliensis]MDT2636731.1 ABC transporter ATP-binding protein [Enterococcus dongliensis]MDT2638850.1 ABC transporter ATP-binding protein [Enterococcus dongliensis]
MTKLNTADLSIGYEKKIVVNDITVEIPKGQITSLIGPNGSGKSTFLKALARILNPIKGEVLLDGENVQCLDTKSIAQKIASLSQSSTQITGLTVAEIVAYGRFPYQKGFSGLKERDHQLIDWAIEATNLQKLKDRTLATLSGGQQQRVWIAMALAQDTDILILDEPITFLDPAHQLEILELLQEINRQGKTILMTIHDLNHASRFSDYLLGMKKGRLLFQGTPKEIFTADKLLNLFDIQATFATLPNSDKPLVIAYDLVREC